VATETTKRRITRRDNRGTRAHTNLQNDITQNELGRSLGLGNRKAERLDHRGALLSLVKEEGLVDVFRRTIAITWLVYVRKW